MELVKSVKEQFAAIKKGLMSQVYKTTGRMGITIKMDSHYSELHRHELEEIRLARSMRMDAEDPRTYKQQEIYRETVRTDGHLRGAMRNRTLRTTNKRYVIKDASGQVDEKRTKWIHKTWFKKALQLAHQSHFYGYSLIWPCEFNEKTGHIKKVKLIPRGHVIPEKRMVVENVEDEHGLPFDEIPEQLWYAELGEDSIGILETSQFLCLLKRHSWANWDTWEQLFVIPMRVVYTDGDEGRQVKIAGWLKNMVRKAYIVLHKDREEIKFEETKKTDAYQVFDKKIERADSENSKLINGQTMTMSDGSSLSQSETHLKTEKEITKDDCDGAILWANDVILPGMRFFGYDLPEGYEIDIEETTVPSEKIEIDKYFLQAGQALDKEYVLRVYGTHLAEELPGEQEESPVKKR